MCSVYKYPAAQVYICMNENDLSSVFFIMFFLLICVCAVFHCSVRLEMTGFLQSLFFNNGSKASHQYPLHISENAKGQSRGGSELLCCFQAYIFLLYLLFTPDSLI